MNSILDLVLKLEEGLERGELPQRECDARRMGLLFRLLLTRLLRQGESSGHAVRNLLALAEDSSAKGRVPASLPAEVRDELEGCASKLREAGAWREDTPLWWEPLPEPGAIENRWRWLAEQGLELPREVEDGVGVRLGAVPEELLQRIYDELEGGAELGLEAEGVGAEGRRSRHRSDEVRYVHGREAELLQRRPWLALFVQHCLQTVAPRLAGHPALRERLGGLAPRAPQTAMLARYAGPSGGYSRHLDNPGGAEDNGRALSLVIYLNPADHRPSGGELEVWRPDDPADAEPRRPAPPWGGNAVLADARRVAHRVRPLEAGAARWTLVLWFRDDQPATPDPPLPAAEPAELLAGVEEPPVPSGHVLRREIAGSADAPRPDLTVLRRITPDTRAGAVVTTFDAGAGLEPWCRHHLDAGLDHLLVIFDRPDETGETELAERLRAAFPSDRLTVWRGPTEADRRWPHLIGDRLDELRRTAAAGDGGSGRDASSAVASRQALHATAALQAARSGELGGAPLDWLLHLDDDEWLLPRGPGRGGATLAEHFAALAPTDVAVTRYLVHELLHPWDQTSPPRFKLNPTLATLRLGPAGWSQVRSRLGDRPYFLAHTNGKAAVRVAAAEAAAGVHGWDLDPEAEHRRIVVVDGPTLLHLPSPTAASFRRKLSRRAAGAVSGAVGRLFPPSLAEERAVERLEDAGGEGLEGLFRELACFDEQQVQVLEAAGLLIKPDLPVLSGR